MRPRCLMLIPSVCGRGLSGGYNKTGIEVDLILNADQITKNPPIEPF
jgi:hypothetical protein